MRARPIQLVSLSRRSWSLRLLTHPRAIAADWIAARLPRRTVRLRLTLMYGGLFLFSGAALLAITYELVEHSRGAVAVFSSQGVSGAIVGTAPGLGPQPAFHMRVAVPAPGALPVPIGPKQAQAQAQQLQALALAQHGAELHQLLIKSGIALAIMAVASMGLGWLIAGRALRPLHTITSATRAISASNLHERLALEGPDDELTELGDTIDGLLARLDASFQSQRQFVANASHELRTPLTYERALLEVALADPAADEASLRRVCERVLAASVEQEQLIEALLTLARGERGLERTGPVDLGAIAESVLASRGGEAERRGLRLRANTAAAVCVGDPRLLERLLANLIDNALRYNKSDGEVEVITAIRGAAATVSVINDGPLVPAAEIERLFEPFQRLASGRAGHGEGHGLGLSIVRAIAQAHGAELVAHARARGGLQVEVRFRRAVDGMDP